MILLVILFGLIPECLFISFFISYSKSIKTHRLLLFLSVLTLNITNSILFRHSNFRQFLFMIEIYLILKLIYKSKIIDLFLVSFLFFILGINSILCILFISNFYIALVLSRFIILIISIICIKKNLLNKLYNYYFDCWDRGFDKPKRAITTRNICILVFNIVIFLSNIWLLNYKK